MADEKTTISSSDIQKIPNSVSGDGRAFVAQLKAALMKFAGNISTSVDKVVDNTTNTAVGQVTYVSLLEQHTTDNLGYPENDVYVQWEKGTVTGYSGATVYYKTSSETEYGYAGDADGVTFTIKKLTTGKTYNVKVVGKNKFGKACDSSKAPVATITIAGESYLPGVPDQFTVTWEGGTPHWQWTAVNTQDYFDGYELRENTDAGKYKGMLDSTTSLTSDAVPSQRSGTAYLFTRSIFGQYGSPRTHAYNLAQPTAPTAPVIETLFQGFNVHMATLPTNCTGIEILATNTSTKDEHSFYTKNDVFQIGILNGNYDFKYRYYDCFGNGEWSNVTNADVTRVIDSSLIGDNAVTADKIISGAITTDKISAGAVTTEKLISGAVTADKIGAYAVTADKIQSGSVTTDKLSANAVTAEKLAAESVTADKIISGAITTEKIAANAVTAGKIGASAVLAENIAAGAVTAGKIKVDSLSAITANVGSLKGGTITGTTLIGGTIIGSTIRNANNTFTVDSNGNVKGINITAGTINANVINQAGYQLHTNSKISGEITSGQIIPLPAGYSEEQCVWGASPNPDKGGRAFLCSIDTRRKVRLNTASGTEGDTVMYGYYWCIGFK